MSAATSQSREAPLYFHVSESPSDNYFFADRSVSCQAILTNPLPDTVHDSSTSHRLLFAWPGGNSGAAVFFEASPDENDARLRISLLVG